MPPPRPRMTGEERRRRIAVRHHLAPEARADTVEQVAGALTALHGTDPATVHLAAGARLAGAAGDPVAAMERALYEDRTLVRMHAMRHTLFVVPTALAPVVQSSTTDAVAARERATLIKQLKAGSSLDEAWLADVEKSALAALERRGEATAAELAQDEPRLREQFLYGPGTRYEQPQTVATRLLRLLGTEGKVVRGRPLGSWTSSRFRWAIAPALPGLPPAEAQAALVRRWLASHGPATEADLAWWSGWRITDVRKALSAVEAVETDLDEGATGYVLPGDTGPAGEPAPWAAFLPALDPTPMGWQQRDWYLDPGHRAELFDRSGNIGPTVWWNGRIIGGWAQRPDGEPVWRLLTDPGSEAVKAVEAEASRLHARLAGTRVTPRFRTPLERSLSA